MDPARLCPGSGIGETRLICIIDGTVRAERSCGSFVLMVAGRIAALAKESFAFLRLPCAPFNASGLGDLLDLRLSEPVEF